MALRLDTSLVLSVVCLLAATGCHGNSVRCLDGEVVVGKECFRACYDDNQCRSTQDCASGVCVACVDTDSDGVCDRSDLCPAAVDTTQDDADGDGLGDACDPCPLDPDNDSDQDGVCAPDDNCPLVANTDQQDGDHDGLGDVCDPCPLDPDNDADGDGICAPLDNCPRWMSANLADSDGDGVGDACDRCPGFDDLQDQDNDGLPNDCEPKLFYDFNTKEGTASATGVGRLGEVFLLWLDDGVHGNEPWRTDGTAEGTYMLRDINPTGDSSVVIRDFERLNGAAFFLAGSGGNTQLWRTDGTTPGTYAITTGELPGPSGVIGLVAGATKLFLVETSSGVNAVQVLWLSNGTPGDAVRAMDLPADTYMDFEGLAATLGDYLYFGALGGCSDGVGGVVDCGRELWRIDGTTGGTAVFDINAGAASSSPDGFVALGTSLYFRATDADHGTELWTVQSSSASPELVVDLVSGPDSGSPRQMTACGSKVCFAGRTSTSDPDRLFISDGTPGSTVIEIPSSKQAGGVGATVNGLVYYSRYDSAAGTEPWVTDLSASTSKRLQDIYPGTTSSQVSDIVPFGAGVAFAATSDVHRALWQSQGATVATVTTAEILTAPAGPTARSLLGSTGSTLLFLAWDEVNGDALWRVNAGSTMASLVKDVTPGNGSSRWGGAAGPVGDRVCVAASTDTTSPATYSIYCGDGVTPGWVVAPLGAAAPLKASLIGAAGQHLWLVEGTNVWVTDGRTPAGTAIIGALPAADARGNATAAGSALYRPSVTKDNATKTSVVLHRYGTSGVTEACRWSFDRATDITGIITPTAVVAHDTVYVAVRLEEPPGQPLRVWRHRLEAGTCDAGTERSSTTSSPVSDGRSIYFLDATSLWWFDGAVEITLSWAGLGLSGVANLTPFKDALYFRAIDATGDDELWRTRGTAATTERVLDINPTGDSSPNRLVVAGDALFFYANDGTHQTQLWTTDGSTTHVVTSFAVPSPLAYYADLVGVGNLAFFVVRDDRHGVELWRSDGTPEGTYVEADINPGTASSDPDNLTAVGDFLVLTATDPEHGTEPWIYHVR